MSRNEAIKADQVMLDVRKMLRFEPASQSKTPIGDEGITASSRTNCYGYTIALSQALEAEGVEHMIAYAKSHSFVTVRDTTSGQTYSYHDASPKYDGPIDEAVTGQDAYDQLAEGKPFAVNKLDTRALLSMRGLTHRIEQLSVQDSWISYQNPNQPYTEHFDMEQYKRSYVLRMLTYPAPLGRHIMKNLYNIRVHLNNRNPEAAAAALLQLRGIYPKTDPRDRLREARELRTMLFKKQLWDMAVQVAEVVDSSLLDTDQSQNRRFLPETNKKIQNLNRTINSER